MKTPSKEQHIRRATRRLSEDISALIRKATTDTVYDVVVVGSGYGGSVAAAELAGWHVSDGAGTPGTRRIKLAVLERGSEYLPGAFPSRFSDLPRHIRFRSASAAQTSGEGEALLDVRLGKGVSALVANGLGGGSLINAGVMQEPDVDGLNRFPVALQAALPGLFNEARERLGASIQGEPNVAGTFSKTRGLKKLTTDFGDARFQRAAVTLAHQDRNNSFTDLNACTACGDCMTGCNVGAKESLDTNLLVQARQNHAEVYTGATVLRLKRESSRGEDLWCLDVVPTAEPLRHRQRNKPLTLKARKVILAAGTLGSTEILMRSSSPTDGHQFSERLGARFSCNGDNLAALYDTSASQRPVARDDESATMERQVGPTITGMVKVPRREDEMGFLVQEFSVPAPLKRLFAEIITTSRTLHRLAEGDDSDHTSRSQAKDPYAIDPSAVDRTLLVGLIGHDEAHGRLNMPEDGARRDHPGCLSIDWPTAGQDRHIVAAHERLAEAAENGHLLGDRGRLLPNPMWRPLPSEISFLAESGAGQMLTVHPLGGCAMGESIDHGVVDDLGRVFDRSGGCFDSSLVVLDGSIIPGSLGGNPALTITAVALRAVRKLRDKHWHFMDPAGRDETNVCPRPIYRTPDECLANRPAATRIGISERLSGAVQVPGSQDTWQVELTLTFEPETVAHLTQHLGRSIKVDESQSFIRLYKLETWEKKVRVEPSEAKRRQQAAFECGLSGTLKLLGRADTTAWQRRGWAMEAWRVNRGMSDIRRGLGNLGDLETIKALITGNATGGIVDRARGLWNLSSLAGEVRLFDYDLKLVGPGSPIERPTPFGLTEHTTIRGQKRLTYCEKGNPWKQLMTVTLQRLGTWSAAEKGPPATLTLDGRYLASQGRPLVSIASQSTQPDAIADLASLGLYMARLLLGIHAWTFRKPDEPLLTPPPNRLPRSTEGLPEPEIYDQRHVGSKDDPSLKLQLTRYCPEKRSDKDRKQPPLLFIHGYGASGTTFAHHAVRPNLAEYFCKKGFDVWILDLRTSPDLNRNPRRAWTFEDVAFADIPLAVQFICKKTKAKKIDVFAHCIGALELSMALLCNPKALPEPPDLTPAHRNDGVQAKRYPGALKRLPDSIRRIVLSQKGPVLEYSMANVFRAYVVQHLRRLMTMDTYEFRPTPEDGTLVKLADRLLSSLPYPDDEFELENPPPGDAARRTRWTGTRHRMDVLYAPDFKASTIDLTTLDSMDDLFGGVHLDTVAQIIPIIRYGRLIDANGDDSFSPKNANASGWKNIPTLFIFGKENAIVDRATVPAMKSAMDRLGVTHYQCLEIDGHGHQDCLIGKHAESKVFGPLHQFLTSVIPPLPTP